MLKPTHPPPVGGAGGQQFEEEDDDEEEDSEESEDEDTENGEQIEGICIALVTTVPSMIFTLFSFFSNNSGHQHYNLFE